jgi:formimidoylglutamate deiminase
MPEPVALWAPRAWVGGRWQAHVVLRADASGHWAEVTPGVGAPPPGCRVLAGPALPGLVDAHSHAFQRAFAGLAERRENAHDDFWSWRDRMYGVALRITPEQLQAIAAQLYVELLRGGYTQVCEFHYLQHAPDGTPYPDPAELAWALADAADAAGIGLTLLPVLYERAGFTQPRLRDDQRRFATDAGQVLALQRAAQSFGSPLLYAGVAIHSLRAASREGIATLMRGLGNDDVPVHVHVAEQTGEVDDCLRATGARPIEWLCRELRPDARWQLVHATHAVPAEIDAVAACGAGIVVCPTTEANLGDGIPDLPRWMTGGVPLAIGSDSQVSRRWPEELRWLEYAQRLHLRQRNVLADPGVSGGSTAARMFEAALHGGGAAAGLRHWGLQVGARADLLVVDPQSPGLCGLPAAHSLDALVFAADTPTFREVHVAARAVVREGAHAGADAIAERHAEVMAELWNP